MFTSYAHAQELLAHAGVVETHYHVGPELVARRYDVESLAEAVKPFGAAIVLKNHTYSTTPLAALARHKRHAQFYGGVVLNSYVGGLNPAAVAGAVSGNKADVTATAPDACPVVVWMPTVDAVSHVKTFGFGFDPKWSGCCTSQADGPGPANETSQGPVVAFDERLRPTPELLDVLDAIAHHGCILATGHLAAEEVMQLIPLALERGVRRIIITHPHYPSVHLTDAQLKTLVRWPGVYVEHCFAIHTQDGVDMRKFADSILETGPDRVLLSTDFGQINSEAFPAGTVIYALEMGRLMQGYLELPEFMNMFTRNGRDALGLPEDRKPHLETTARV